MVTDTPPHIDFISDICCIFPTSKSTYMICYTKNNIFDLVKIALYSYYMKKKKPTAVHNNRYIPSQQIGTCPIW